MSSVLVLFAHPSLEKSRAHKSLVARLSQMDNLTFNDLYEMYPDFDIDVKREQNLLLDHDIIIWQHPMYWYSSPALIKQWQDLVLEHGWAYGKTGKMLAGKKIFNAISTGGTQDAYTVEGFHQHTIEEFLLPFSQTAKLCNMDYWPPFLLQGTHRLQQTDFDFYSWQFEALCLALTRDEITSAQAHSVRALNELISQPHPTN
jgi:glutathione-regulated potassium-efflux system ancillary protein KefG